MHSVDFLLDATQRVHTWWHVADHEQVPAMVLADLRAIEQEYRPKVSPLLVIAVWDSPTGAAWRQALLPTYKAGRKVDEGFLQVLERSKALVHAEWPTPSVEVDGQEADDAIASIAARATSERRVVIVSRDKDLRQCLVPGAVSILNQFSRGGGKFLASYITAASLKEEFGFGPERWVEYQALVGQQSDNVVGWTGVGDVRACDMLTKCSLDEWLERGRKDISSLPKWARDGFSDFESRWPVLRQVLTLRRDVA